MYRVLGEGFGVSGLFLVQVFAVEALVFGGWGLGLRV